MAHKNLLCNSVFYHASFVTKLVFHAEEKVIVYKNSIDMTTGKQLVEELTVDNFFEKYRTSIEEPDRLADSVSEINGAVLGDKLNVQDIKEMAAEYNCRMLMD